MPHFSLNAKSMVDVYGVCPTCEVTVGQTQELPSLGVCTLILQPQCKLFPAAGLKARASINSTALQFATRAEVPELSRLSWPDVGTQWRPCSCFNCYHLLSSILLDPAPQLGLAAESEKFPQLSHNPFLIVE